MYQETFEKLILKLESSKRRLMEPAVYWPKKHSYVYNNEKYEIFLTQELALFLLTY